MMASSVAVAAAMFEACAARPVGSGSGKRQQPTRFQIACMTLPYSQYPLARALEGIRAAGFQYVAWGTTHREAGESKRVPVMPVDAPPSKAKELAARCREMGLTPVMMFSTIYPEASDGVRGVDASLQASSRGGDSAGADVWAYRRQQSASCGWSGSSSWGRSLAIWVWCWW